jgi:hypothetical protein
MKFWETMVWIDNHISHPLWDFIDPHNNGTFLDPMFYNFCQWVWNGYYNSLFNKRK